MAFKLSGALFCFALFITSFLGAVFMHGPLLPLVFLRPKLARKLMDATVGWWLVLPVALLELFCGTKVCITGDRIRTDVGSLIIMNHRSRLDWMFFWNCLCRHGSLSNEKIILKKGLKQLPGAGWCMQNAIYIFLSRQWPVDQLMLGKIIDYYDNINLKAQVLLFPEGTDLTERSKELSDKYADANNLERYEYVLHPRTTGFTYIVQYMRRRTLVDSVYDVTISYPRGVPTRGELDILNGNFPERVNFHVKKHRIASLPITETGLKEWCERKWMAKEGQLKKLHADYITDTNSNDTTPDSSNISIYLWVNFTYWTLYVVGISLLLWVSYYAKIYLVFMILFYGLLSRYYGGLEHFQIDVFNRFFRE